MSSVFATSAIPAPNVAFTGAWSGIIAADVADMSDLAYAVIPAFTSDLRIGPCRWQSRDDTSRPAKGDKCLIVYDDTGVPWIPAWWPF